MPYPFRFNTEHGLYFFTSKGPNGEIIKVVLMQGLGIVGRSPRYNFAMGDLNPKTKRLSFYKRSANKDGDLLLKTVHEILLDFTARHPDAEIIITGNTPVKKRLYQLQVTKYLNILEVNFVVEGATRRNSRFEVFVKGKSYKVILIRRK